MDFELTQEQRIIRDTAARFARYELEPIAAELDRTKDRDKLKSILKKLAELGFMGLSVAPEYG